MNYKYIASFAIEFWAFSRSFKVVVYSTTIFVHWLKAQKIVEQYYDTQYHLQAIYLCMYVAHYSGLVYLQDFKKC